MILKILRFILGYLKVEIKGFAPERFINLINQNNIVSWDVSSTNDGYILFTGRKNLLKMKAYLQKTNIKLKILEKHGLPFLIKNNKKRTTFLFGFFLFFLIIYSLSLYIWEVDVIGENKLVADSILKEIKEKYVPLGTRKRNIDCNFLESSLRKEFEEISWISCELKGTCLTIHLEEGILPIHNKKDHIPGDIVAKKNATIIKMITRDGTPIVKTKQKVKKGDILISGTIYIYDDNNEIIETNYICADGDIIGKTNIKYEDYIDLKYYEKEYKDQKKKSFSLYFLDYTFTPYTPNIQYKNYDCCTNTHKFKIFNNFYLPFGVKIIEYRPYSLIAKKHSENSAENILKSRLNKKIKDYKIKGVEIIQNNVKIIKNQNRIEYTGTLVVHESISSFQESGSKLFNQKSTHK